MLVICMDFDWKDGKWSHKEVDPEIKLYVVPMLDGSMHIIKQTAVDEAVLSLGIQELMDVNSMEHWINWEESREMDK